MNPVALITGASRGIGRGIALALAKIGFDLVINYAANEAAAEQTAGNAVSLAHEAGRKVRADICRADISLNRDRHALIDFTRANFGRIDLLVNNAGIAPSARTDILEASEESFDRLISTNVKGPYFLTQLAANWMVEIIETSSAERHSSSPESADQSGGAACPYQPKIITISSVSAYTASVNRGDYCIAKAALSMITPLYAARLAEYGIRVYEIRPGIIATDMTSHVIEKYNKLISEGLTPIKRWGTAEDVAKAVVAIAQDLLPFSTGEVINVDGGFHLRRL